MHFPFYDMNFYIGFLVLAWFTVSTLRRYQRTGSSTQLYLSVTSLSLSIAMLAYGIPALFTSSTRTLSYFTFVGDVSQAVAWLSIWLLSIKVFLSNKPMASLVAKIMVICLAVACSIASLFNNLRPPYSTTLVPISRYTSDIHFEDSLSYTILNGIDCIALLLLSYYFWQQARDAPTSGQKLRIRCVAFVFLLTSILHIVLPAVPLNNTLELRSTVLSFIFILIALSGIIGHHMNKREVSTAVKNT